MDGNILQCLFQEVWQTSISLNRFLYHIIMKYLRHDGEKTIKDLRNLSRLKRTQLHCN